ncbi:MAG: hypothetical protein QW666_03715 [Candidatus Woesearchaeota archaeon]
MKIVPALILLFFLISCVPVPEPEKIPEMNENIKEAIEPVKQEAESRTVEPAAFVEQSFKDSTARYGFDDAGQLISIEGSKNTVLQYDGAGHLVGIDGINLEYADGLLRSVDDNGEITTFEYSSGRLSKIISKKMYITFTYDVAGTLIGVSKGQNPAVMFTYDEKNNINTIENAGSVFNLYYDDKGKLKDIDMRDSHIIIGRGKESRLVSLTGQLYGQGEMFDYMNDRIKVISNVEPSEFTGPDNLRIKAFNLYLICTRIKQLDVIFDAIPYAIVRNYFGMDVYDYVVNNYFCEAFR